MTQENQEATVTQAPAETQYIVTWTIDIEATSPREAARKARDIQRRYSSDAEVFEVRMNDQDLTEAKRIDLSISEFDAAKRILVEACTNDMLNTMRYDRDFRETIVREGFGGFRHMSAYDLARSARDAGLAEKDEEVRWAIEIVE